jgi:hypothetical protein
MSCDVETPRSDLSAHIAQFHADLVDDACARDGVAVCFDATARYLQIAFGMFVCVRRVHETPVVVVEMRLVSSTARYVDSTDLMQTTITMHSTGAASGRRPAPEWRRVIDMSLLASAGAMTFPAPHDVVARCSSSVALLGVPDRGVVWVAGGRMVKSSVTDGGQVSLVSVRSRKTVVVAASTMVELVAPKPGDKCWFISGSSSSAVGTVVRMTDARASVRIASAVVVVDAALCGRLHTGAAATGV